MMEYRIVVCCVLALSCARPSAQEGLRLTEAEKVEIKGAKEDIWNAKCEQADLLEKTLAAIAESVFIKKDIKALSGKVFDIATARLIQFDEAKAREFKASDVSQLIVLGKDYWRNLARVMVVEKHDLKDDYYCMYFQYEKKTWYLLDGSIQRKWPNLWRHALAKYYLELDSFKEGDPDKAEFKELYQPEHIKGILSECEARYTAQKRRPVGLWFQMLYSPSEATTKHAITKFELLLSERFDIKNTDVAIGAVKRALYAKYEHLRKWGLGGARDEVEE